MLQRVIITTSVAVVISAAAAFALAPGFSQVRRQWGSDASRGAHRFMADRLSQTYVIPPSDSSRSEGGSPGTYCPIRSPESNPRLRLDQGASVAPDSNSEVPHASSSALFDTATPKNCTPLAAPPARPATP